MEVTAFLCLGANLDDRLYNLTAAAEHIRNRIGLITASSGIYECGPWGYKSDHDYLNMALQVKTVLGPEEILEEIIFIEKIMGRTRERNKYTDRNIDIDLLLYADKIISTDKLTVPHPLMHKRRFVLKALSDIASEVVHPVIKKSIGQLLNECEDFSKVVIYSNPESRNASL